jgi:hypothetical protein
MANLSGQYQIANSTLVSLDNPNQKLVIGTRKKPTPQKPPNYLLAALPGGKFTYLSSLFPAPNWAENGCQTYSLDYQGRYYTLEIDRTAGVASISPNTPGNPTSPINNVGLGVKFTPDANL